MAILEKFEKQPADVQDFDISFAAWLTALSDTTLSHVTTVDAGITQSTPSSVTNGVAKVWLSGGLHGKTYKVTVTLTTVGGRIKQVEILIKVKET